jgi:hypothetical protein
MKGDQLMLPNYFRGLRILGFVMLISMAPVYEVIAMDEFKLETGDRYSKEKINNEFIRIDETPYIKAPFLYRLLIPKDWQVVQLEKQPDRLPSDSPIPVAHLATKSDDGTQMVLMGISLTREISAGDWLRIYLRDKKYSLLTLKALSPVNADSMVGMSIAGNEFIGRIAVRIHGNILLVLVGVSPRGIYQKYGEQFEVSAHYFEVVGSRPKETIEKREIYDIKKIIRFQYPESWHPVVFAHPPKGKQAVDFLWFDVKKEPQGMIRVKTVVKGVPNKKDAQLKDALDEVTKEGNEMKTVISSYTLSIRSDRFQSGIQKVYAGKNPEGTPYESWITVFEGEKYYYIVTLLTRERKVDFPIWAINLRAYQIVMETMGI